MKTIELTGPALDWAVAKAEGHTLVWDSDLKGFWFESSHGWLCNYRPSQSWVEGGPIIEREGIELLYSRLWKGWQSPDKRNAALSFIGDTPLIAAMRCYVASKLGDNVDIPKELQ